MVFKLLVKLKADWFQMVLVEVLSIVVHYLFLMKTQLLLLDMFQCLELLFPQELEFEVLNYVNVIVPLLMELLPLIKWEFFVFL
jgi:hypothetical protein